MNFVPISRSVSTRSGSFLSEEDAEKADPERTPSRSRSSTTSSRLSDPPSYLYGVHDPSGALAALTKAPPTLYPSQLASSRSVPVSVPAPKDDARDTQGLSPGSLSPQVRRTAKAAAVNGFVKDVLEGLDSEFFQSANNVNLDDARSFDPEVAAFLKNYMAKTGCSFDEARLELIRDKMRKANIDPDTGLPLDAKLLDPGMLQKSVVDVGKLHSRQSKLKSNEPSKWDTGLLDENFIGKLNDLFGPN